MKRRLVSGKPSISRRMRYALAVFTVGMVVGWVVTHFVAPELASRAPAGESNAAMRHDVRATKYTLIGWGITFLVSSVAAVAVGLRFYDPKAAARDDELGQARCDET